MYVKLFSSILTSSVWTEDATTRVVWITMLALSDREGFVRSSPSGLARLSNVAPDVCASAIAKFLSPDIESGTQEYEGRRIEEVAGGWFVLNYAKYRDMQDEESRKAQWRESSKTYRQRKSANRQRQSAPNQHGSAHTDTEAATDTQKKGKRPPIVDPSKNSNGEAAIILSRIRALAEERGGQVSGRVIRRNKVEEMGADILAAYEAVGGSERVLGATGEKVSFLMKDFANALAAARQ